MAVKSLSALKTDALVIQQEQTDGANTADRVGAMIVALLKGMALPYDSSTAYEAGQWMLFSGTVCRAITATLVGQNPDSHPNKWDRFIIDDTSLITANGSKMPVSARALAQYVNARIQNASDIPVANYDTAGKLRRIALEELQPYLADGVTPTTDLNGYVAPPELFAALKSLIEYSLTTVRLGLPEVLQNDSSAPDLTPTVANLRLAKLTGVDNPECYLAVVKDPDGVYELRTANPPTSSTTEPPTVPVTLANQTYVQGVTKSYQFDEFPGATDYKISVAGNAPGFTVDEINRVITVTSDKLGDTIIQIIGINAGGRTPAEIVFTGVPAAVPELISSVYWAENEPEKSLSVYVFGYGETSGGINIEIRKTSDNSVVIPARKLVYSPGEYTREGLFSGAAPYSALIAGLTIGTEYKALTWIEGSTDVKEGIFTFSTNGKGKLYPAVSNILAFKPATASSNNANAGRANDEDNGTFWLSSTGLNEAIQFDLGVNYRAETFSIDTGDTLADNFYVIGYPDNTTLPPITAPLNDSLNVPGAIKTGVSTNSDNETFIPNLNSTFRYLRLQKSNSAAFKIVNAVLTGFVEPNIPPALVEAIANVVITEGDALTKDTRSNFNDANQDNLTYTVKRKNPTTGEFTEDLYSWLTFSNGVFIASAAGYEGGAGTTSTVDTIRVFASDGKASVFGDFTLTVNKKNTVPAGLQRAYAFVDKNNMSLTVLANVDAGTPTVEVIGITSAYPNGAVKSAVSGTFSNDKGTNYNRRAIFNSVENGKTYKVRITLSAGVFEATITLSTNSTRDDFVLYPVSTPGTATITNVSLDEARLASSKQVTALSEASELVQFQLRKASDNSIVFNFTDGPLSSSKYTLVNNTVLIAGEGYVLTARIKSTPAITKDYSFTVPLPSSVGDYVTKVEWALYGGDPGVIGVAFDLRANTTALEGLYFRIAGGPWRQMTRFGTSGSVYINPEPNNALTSSSARTIEFSKNGSTVILSTTIPAGTPSTYGVWETIYPFEPPDTPAPNYLIRAEPSIADYRVRHADGKAYWRLVINRGSYHFIYFTSTGQPVVDDTAEHAVEIGEIITLYGYLTRSTTGLDLQLQDNNGSPPYNDWINRRPLVTVYTDVPKLDS